MKVSIRRKLESLVEFQEELSGLLCMHDIINNQERYRALSDRKSVV